jgi:hypothetical protein
MPMFLFGQPVPMVSPTGRWIHIGEFSLHVQCAWRLTRGSEILVGSADLNLTPDGERPDLEGVATRFDERSRRFVRDRCPVMVREVSIDVVGGLCVRFDGAVELGVFPDDSLGDEYWRVVPAREDQDHIVCGGSP